jgi:hypothetical protein
VMENMAVCSFCIRHLRILEAISTGLSEYAKLNLASSQSLLSPVPAQRKTMLTNLELSDHIIVDLS